MNFSDMMMMDIFVFVPKVSNIYVETVPIYIRYITFNVFSANNLTRKLYYFHSMEG